MSRIFLITLILALSACGTRGPLEMPPGPAPEPILGGKAGPIIKDSNGKMPISRKPAQDSSTNLESSSQ
jgi:predicted small lipoprotein YifL